MSDFFATCGQGLEKPLMSELSLLGAAPVTINRGGVAFSGDLELAYRACQWSRVASRVLLPLTSFAAPDEDALYDGIRSIKWQEHLGPEQTLAVDFVTSQSQVSHSHFGALRTKDAIVDQLRDELGARPSIARFRPDVRVNVHLHRDQAIVSIDLSGESLHRRGYRDEAVSAPLKENLAAAILYLADWPRLCAQGVPFIDPMCGSGTIPIEAALMAANIAPGQFRDYYGFLGWRGHDAARWSKLKDETRGEQGRLPEIVGYDASALAIHSAQASARRAGVKLRLEIRAFADVTPVGASPGLMVLNPPYGERLGSVEALHPLYRGIGDGLRRKFPGWTGMVLTGNKELAKEIGLKTSGRFVMWNGPIECRLLRYEIAQTPVVSDGPKWRQVNSKGAEAFVNRVKKNRAHLRKWAKRSEVHCYRIYDADLPEYAVAVDLYEGAACVQEYEPPKTVDEAKAQARLREVLAVLPGAIDVSEDQIYFRVRRRQRGITQYEKQAESHAVRIVREGGLRFEVNLSDYLDTGLFLDHRTLRAHIRELARGRRFLNLFAYTGTATVYAAHGGARATTSVDLSTTYLEWAQRNLKLNGFRDGHELVRADCLEWLSHARGRYDLIFIAPPAFSRSKRMEGTFELDRDHVRLLSSARRLLEPGGIVLFSSHARRFKLDAAAVGMNVEEITAKTIPEDFARVNPKMHRTWKLEM